SKEFAYAGESVDNGLPAAILDVMANHKLYKSTGDHVRLAAVRCNPDGGLLNDLPAGFALSFVDDSTAFWNSDFFFNPVTWSGLPFRIVIRFVGYGIDKFYLVDPTTVTGYKSSTRQRLVVTISAAQDAAITGYEVAAVVRCGSDISFGVNYNQMTMWCGFKSLIGVTSATHDWKYVPLGQQGTVTAEVGDLNRTFKAVLSSTAGSLKNGKTYYVAVLSHHIKLAANPDSRCAWRIPNVNRNGTDIVAVTIPGDSGSTGSIVISEITPDSISFMVAIGETPELMMPVAIYNDSGDIHGGGTEWTIDAVPDGSPALIDIRPYATNQAYYQFRMSD